MISSDGNVVFRPHPGAQMRFMQWKGRYALLGGAAGGGKTLCLLYDPFRQIAVETERVRRGEITSSVGRAIFFRRTMPELREALDRAKRTFKLIDNRVEWNEATKTFTFSCGYKYMFGQMEDPGDWMKYYGFEFTEILWDELTTFTEEQYDQLDTRLRTSDPVLRNMLYVRAGTNPVGIGLQWVRKRFVECAPPGTPVIRRIRTPVVTDGVTKYVAVEHQQIFIPARLSDNPSIDQAQYAATLVTKASAVRRQLLEGDWYVSLGAWVGDLWEPDIHVCEPFEIPRGWTKFRMADYGYASPSSVQWCAVDPDNNFVIYRSLSVKRHNAEMLAYRIREIEIDAGEWDLSRGCSKLSGPLDHSCWGQHGHVGPTIAETMMRIGVTWTKCDKDRHAAADQFRWRLTRRTGHPTLKEEDGSPAMIVPGIRWFNTCLSPIKTIPILPADKDDPEVPDTDGDDHDWDSTAYGCMSRPLIPLDDKTTNDDFDEIIRAKRKLNSGGQRPRLGYRGMW